MNHQLPAFLLRTSKLSVLVCALVPLWASAAETGDHPTTPPVSRPEFLPNQADKTFQLPALPPAGATAAPTESVTRFQLDKVAFRGNTVFTTLELEAVAAPYTGRHISAAELEDLRQLLTRHYIEHGYVNSGVLVAQQSEGTVHFEVVEGRITSIRLQGLDGLEQAYVARRLAKASDGPLNLHTLRERYQLLLGDPLVQRMNARLIPDERLGEAILDIELERTKSYQLSAFINNYRPPSIGEQAAGLSGWVRNLTGKGDLLEATLQNATAIDTSRRASLAWRMPLGYSGTQFLLDWEQGYSSVIENPMKALAIDSAFYSRDLGLSQVLLETLGQKYSIGINQVERENRTWMLGTAFSFNPGEPAGVVREDLWRLWQEYTYRTENHVLSARLSFINGKNNLQAIAGLPASTSNDPTQKFHIWLGQVHYARKLLDNGAQIVFKGSVQSTANRLLSMDGIAIGGVNTVRGFRENALTRDNGQTFSLEFDYPAIRNGRNGVNLSLIPFYDFGRGWNNGETAENISSAGLVARMQHKGLSFDLAVARPLIYTAVRNAGNGSLQDKGVHLQLRYQVF